MKKNSFLSNENNKSRLIKLLSNQMRIIEIEEEIAGMKYLENSPEQEIVNGNSSFFVFRIF